MLGILVNLIFFLEILETFISHFRNLRATFSKNQEKISISRQ